MGRWFGGKPQSCLTSDSTTAPLLLPQSFVDEVSAVDTPRPHRGNSVRPGPKHDAAELSWAKAPKVRMDAAAGNADAKARAVIATSFACLDAASMTWVADDGKGEIMDLYDECLAAVRG